MNAQRKVPVSVLADFPGSGKTTLLNQILVGQSGTGRVRGPEKGYVRCEREYLAGRRRTEQGPR